MPDAPTPTSSAWAAFAGVVRRRLPAAGRIRTPTVLQMEVVECGAAALAMVLAYYGRYVPLEQLRVACGVSRDGSKALNIVKAARGFGLLCKGYKKEPEQLRAIPMPAIVFWNFNHFVVLEGFDGERVRLNDPASGPRVVSAQEFDESFTGVVLVFEKGPDFRPGGEKPSVLRSLGRRLPGSRVALAFVVLASLALTVPGLVIPAFARVFVDRLLVAGTWRWLVPLLWAMAATAAVRALLTALQQRGLLRLEMTLSLGASGRFFRHVLRLPVEFFAQRFAGEIASRVEINDHVATLLSGEFATSLVNLVMVAFFFVLMLQYDAGLALLGAATAGANLVLLNLLARRRKDGNRRLLQQRGKLIGASMAGLQGLETLKATGGEPEFFATWAGHHARVVLAEQELQATSRYLSLVPPLLTGINGAAVLALGGLRVIDGALTMGMLIAFQGLMLGFIEPVNRLVELGGKLQEAEGDMNRLDDVLHHVPDPLVGEAGRSGPATSSASKLDGHLELRGVTFGYSRLEAPLITGFSLTMTPGMRVALVGASGSGKSTVAKLVTGLYAPWDGDVLLDGRPRADHAREVVSRSIALVDQDVVLFEGTIRDNLTLWDDQVPQDVVVRAATDACIHDDVAERAGGYDHPVAEQGRNFSGGQRQRLEIARAFVGDPCILVLDEATSALDPITEQRVNEAVRRRGCTCLIVAHRLSTIRDCDQIVVLEKGQVVERGTHEELLEHNGVYARLIGTM